MDRLLEELNNTEPAEGCERVYYAGQKEHEAERNINLNGVPLSLKVFEQLCSIGRKVGWIPPAPLVTGFLSLLASALLKILHDLLIQFSGTVL
jgi:hypothetical protein